MQFGFRTRGFLKWGMDRALSAVAQIGYDGVEICLEHPDSNPIRLGDADEIEVLGKLVSNAGLEISAVSYHIGTDTETISRTIEIVGELDADIVVINGDPIPAAGKEAEWLRMVERLRKLAERAELWRVTLAMELEPGFMVASSADFAQLVEEVDSPVLKLNMDIGHAHITDGGYLAWMRQLGEHLAYLHIKDIKDGVHAHLVPGQGDLDFGALKATLDEIGYDGPYVVDLFAIQDAPDRFARESLLALRRLWRIGWARARLPGLYPS